MALLLDACWAASPWRFTYGIFEDPDSWPDTVDYEGPNALIFARRPVLHYTMSLADERCVRRPPSAFDPGMSAVRGSRWPRPRWQMENIVPRWEWRTFAASFGDADQRFRELPPGKVQKSDELYLLSPGCDANVKIRGGLMDIKSLEQVDARGLEQWRPVMKAGFPLPAAEVAKVCAALQVAPLPLRDAYALESMQAELTHPSRGVRAVPIHKKRQRYDDVGGCLAEVTELAADGRTTRTVAIESEDPARVWAAVREMGLERFENLSYPRGLKRLLGWPT